MVLLLAVISPALAPGRAAGDTALMVSMSALTKVWYLDRLRYPTIETEFLAAMALQLKARSCPYDISRDLPSLGFPK